MVLNPNFLLLLRWFGDTIICLCCEEKNSCLVYVKGNRACFKFSQLFTPVGQVSVFASVQASTSVILCEPTEPATGTGGESQQHRQLAGAWGQQISSAPTGCCLPMLRCVVQEVSWFSRGQCCYITLTNVHKREI